jgi:alpha-1,6-mannosyltransferase
MRFAAVGIASAVVYALLVVWVPLLPSNVYAPLLDLGKITGYTWRSSYQYLGIVGALYALYVVGYVLVRKGNAHQTAIALFGVVFCVELLGAYPATAVDVFGYIAHGRMLAEHHMNPFVTPPNAYPSDSILPFLAFPGEPSQYGPGWVLLGYLQAFIGRGDLLAEVLFYKVVAAVAHLGSAAVIVSIGRRLGANPCQALAGGYLFLWNPLLLWEMVGNAHNDGLMMLGALLAVWLLLRRANVLVMPALALGALVKLPAAVLSPLFLIALARRSKAAAVESLALAAVLVALVYRPFWEGVETLTALRRTELFTASLGSVLRLAGEPWLGQVTSTTVARAVSLGAFVLVVAVCIGFTLRVRDAQRLLTLAYITMLAAVLLATTWFQAWYVVWPFALAAAIPNTQRHVEVGLLSLGGLLQYYVFIYLWVIGFFPPQETLELQGAAYLAIVGPPLLGVAITVWSRYARVYKEPLRAN